MIVGQNVSAHSSSRFPHQQWQMRVGERGAFTLRARAKKAFSVIRLREIDAAEILILEQAAINQ